MRGVETMDKKQFTKLSSYFTMGDGGVYSQNDKTYNFIMNMREENMDYINWVAEVLSELTEVKTKLQPDYNTDGYNRKPLVRLWTKNHPWYAKLRERIYTDKYKGLDPHALKMLDFEALAILYMCDGSLYIDPPSEKKGLVNPSYNVALNMKRLSYGDQFILKKALKDILDLEWNINRHGKYYYLRLRTKDVDKFMEGVRPYILPSFNYKLKNPNG
jgi:hypothetical protein